MKLVIQRVSSASCTVENEIIGSIDNGYVVFVGVAETDTEEIADKLIKKLIRMRIFPDSEGKTNLSLADVSGELLIISQFTLYADCKKGNRPSFIKAGNPQLANRLYEYVIEECRKQVQRVETGRFGADMQISLKNEGPFTIILDSDEMC